jgi:3-hydroxyisobutyrate dehydrogenase-like beta-hydroxyacid dehydrogenase
MKIGFIGLGIMGSRMAANLQKHGHPLVVFNRKSDPCSVRVERLRIPRQPSPAR